MSCLERRLKLMELYGLRLNHEQLYDKAFKSATDHLREHRQPAVEEQVARVEMEVRAHGTGSFRSYPEVFQRMVALEASRALSKVADRHGRLRAVERVARRHGVHATSVRRWIKLGLHKKPSGKKGGG